MLREEPERLSLARHRRVRVRVPLVQRKMLSHDTVRLTFSLGDDRMALGLPVGSCLKFFGPNVDGVKVGEWNGRADGEAGKAEISRKYTPTSSRQAKGSFDLVVKVYKKGELPQFPDGGKFSQHLGGMKVGDEIEMSGPWGLIEYTGPGAFAYGNKGPPDKKTHIGMIAGGAGLTPMLQVISAVLENPNDDTVCSMIYANKTVDDILCRGMLDEYARDHPDRFRIHYTLDNPGVRLGREHWLCHSGNDRDAFAAAGHWVCRFDVRASAHD